MKLGSVAFLLVVTLTLAGCSGSEHSSPPTPRPGVLEVTGYGPNVTAGTPFNVQSDGQSAMWAFTRNATSSTVIVINEKRLPSVPAADGKTVTALVPNELFAQAGEYPMYLLDVTTRTRSNQIWFVVR